MLLNILYGDIAQEKEWDYIPVTISDESTGETITIKFIEPIEIVSPYVEKFAKYLLRTKEFEGKLVTINIMARK